ncbi:DUF5999 family protein [Actinoplanes sp. CA-054009]
MCEHQPQCPAIDQPGAETAQVITHHADLGWAMLCNGAIRLDSAVQAAPVIAITSRKRRAARPVTSHPVAA